MIPHFYNLSINKDKIAYWYHPEDTYFIPNRHFTDNSFISFSNISDGLSSNYFLSENMSGISFYLKRNRYIEFSRFGLYLSFGLERFVKFKLLITKLFSIFILYFSSLYRKFPVFSFKKRKYFDLYDRDFYYLFNNRNKKIRQLNMLELKNKGYIYNRIDNYYKRSYSYGYIKGKIIYFFFKKKINYFFKKIIFNQKKIIFFSLYKKYENFFFFYIKKIFYNFLKKKILIKKHLLKNKKFFIFFFKKLFTRLISFIYFFRDKYLKKYIFNVIKKYIFSKYYNYLQYHFFNKLKFNNIRFMNNSFFNNIFLLFNNYFFNFFKEKSISLFNKNNNNNDFFNFIKYKNEYDFYFSFIRYMNGLNYYGKKFSRHRVYFSYIERRLKIFRSFFIYFFNLLIKARERDFVYDIYHAIYGNLSPFSLYINNLYTNDVKRQLLNYCIELSCRFNPLFSPLYKFNEQMKHYKNIKKYVNLDTMLKRTVVLNSKLSDDDYIRPIGVPDFVSRLRYSLNKKYKRIFYKYMSRLQGRRPTLPIKFYFKKFDSELFLKNKPVLGKQFTKYNLGYKNFLDIGFYLAIQLRKYPEKWIHTNYIFKKHKNKGKRKERYKTIPSSFFIENTLHNYIIPFHKALKDRFDLTARELLAFFRKIKHKFLFPLSNFILFFFCFNNRLDFFLHKLFSFYNLKQIRLFIKKGFIFVNGEQIKDHTFLINSYDFINFFFGWSINNRSNISFYFDNQYFLMLFYSIFTLGRHVLRNYLKLSLYRLLINNFNKIFSFANTSFFFFIFSAKYCGFINLFNLKTNVNFFDGNFLLKYNLNNCMKSFFFSNKIFGFFFNFNSVKMLTNNLVCSFENEFFKFYKRKLFYGSFFKSVRKYFFFKIYCLFFNKKFIKKKAKSRIRSTNK